MEEELNQRFNEAYELLKMNADDSFKYIKDNPNERKYVIGIWKSFAKKLSKDIIQMSQDYDDKETIKSISKMILFGR